MLVVRDMDRAERWKPPIVHEAVCPILDQGPERGAGREENNETN